MPLQGTFDILDFSEIVRLLGRQGVTGRLHLRSRSVTANLFFEDGSLVGADQSEHQAAAATGDVRSRLEEVCFELLEADRGTFEFQPGKATSLPGAVKLKVETVLTRARKRMEEWRQLVERVPNLDVHPQIVTDLDVSEVTLDKELWRMLTAIDGRRNLRAIGRSLNLSDFDACRILVGLMDAGVAQIDVAEVALATTNRDLVPTIPLPDHMADSVVSGDPDDPVESVRVTRRTKPSDDEKRASTKPTTVGPVGPSSLDDPASPRRARRRRTEPQAPTPPEATSGETADPAVTESVPEAQAEPEADSKTSGEGTAGAKRSRRVIRIRSRQSNGGDEEA